MFTEMTLDHHVVPENSSIRNILELLKQQVHIILLESPFFYKKVIHQNRMAFTISHTNMYPGKTLDHRICNSMEAGIVLPSHRLSLKKSH